MLFAFARPSHARGHLQGQGAQYRLCRRLGAIFASLEDLRAALAAPPSLRKKWIALGSGKFSAQSKGVEYLCTSMLGDTVVLDTCYPKNRKYPKSDIQSSIEKVKTRQIANVETFYSEVAKLKQV